MSSNTRHGSSALEAARKFRAQASVTDDFIVSFFASLDTPKSLAAHLLYKYGEHDQLLDLETVPAHYPNGFAFRSDYCATQFLSKASFLKTSYNRTEVAHAKFQKFEELCADTNNRFLHPSLDPLFKGPSVWLLNAVKQKIARVLGDFSGDEWMNESNWGPGVTTALKGCEVSRYNKFSSERGITRDLYSLVGDLFPVAYPLWFKELTLKYGDNPFSFVVGNEIITVPKNSKADRVIAVEPGLNLWFQKGIGRMIRSRLLGFGIDLTNQTRNQSLAHAGSQQGTDLATIDFSSASDSISLELVRYLLPPVWFQVMDSCRSKLGAQKGKPLLRWNKFSSMGNGFTFELESLIFYAAASAVIEFETKAPCPRSAISVFGDDVIIPATNAQLFDHFSTFLGFRVNRTKSHTDGPFRESCGEHFFDGLSCKPIFLEERLRYVESFYKLANSVRTLAHRYNFYRSCDGRFRNCWSYLLRRVPKDLRIFVPRTAGDTGFIGNFDEATPTRARNGIEGYYYRALNSVAVCDSSEAPGILLAKMTVRETDPEFIPRISRGRLALSEFAALFRKKEPLRLRAFLMNDYPLRGKIRRRISRSLVARWYNLGEWEV